MQHLLEIIGQRVVMTCVVVFRRHVVPGDHVGREPRLYVFVGTLEVLANMQVAERGAERNPGLNLAFAVAGGHFFVV